MKKKKIIIFSVFIIILLVFGLIVYKNNYKNKIYVENNEKNVKNSENLNKIPGMVSLMLETGVDTYTYEASSSNEYPTKKYEFNEGKSGCENGGTLSWDGTKSKLVLKTKLSDKCYAYFDKIPPDVTLSITNRPTTYGKLGNINCANSSATYNQQYNRVEISSIDNEYTSCSLNYTDSTSKVNLADYIISLAGTTQGTGQVVSERGDIPDYSSTTAISKDAYVSQSSFLSSSEMSTSGTTASDAYTFANNTWTSVPSAMISNKYYHFKFNPKENGYYQLCFDLSAGNYNNELIAFVNSNWKEDVLASSSTAISRCTALGYVTTSDYIKITQKAYTDISTVSFSIKKVTKVQENVNAGIRYEGKNPNNYIWFNNEYWRIIGVFDSTSHGQANKNLVKIIRADVLDTLVWDKNNENDWSKASLKSLLNGAYYNAEDGTNTGYCYGHSKVVPANCDYTKRGIQLGYRGMIANVTWYLGGYSSISGTTGDYYGFERGTIVYSGRPTSTTGYIGLMYPSDYGYSVLASSCARTTNSRSYISATCAGQSWIYGKGYEWTLMPSSSERRIVLFLDDIGMLGDANAYNGRGSRPVLYLDASVYKIDGDGSMNSPYIVGM